MRFLLLIGAATATLPRTLFPSDDKSNITVVEALTYQDPYFTAPDKSLYQSATGVLDMSRTFTTRPPFGGLPKAHYRNTIINMTHVEMPLVWADETPCKRVDPTVPPIRTGMRGALDVIGQATPLMGQIATEWKAIITGAVRTTYAPPTLKGINNGC